MAHRDLIKHPNSQMQNRWAQAGIDEFAAHLAQGFQHSDGSTVHGMDVVTFVACHTVPTNKEATHAWCVVDCCPEKDESWHLCITCVGDKLQCDSDTATHGAAMETIK